MHEAFLNYKAIIKTAPRYRMINYLLLPPFYCIASIYAGIRIWQAYGMWLSLPLYLIVCCLLFSLGPAALLSFGLSGYSSVRKAIATIGSLWVSAVLYGLLVSWILELIRLIDSHTGAHLSDAIGASTFLPAITVCVSAVLLFLLIFFSLAIYNAAVPRIHRYTIKLPNIANSIKLVLLSDAHLVNLTSPVNLDRLCQKVGSLNSDAVLLAGDIIDNQLDVVQNQRIAERLATIRSKYGVFYTPGNHEYLHAAKGSRERSGLSTDATFHDRVTALLSYFKKSGIHVLSDEKITLDGLCTIVGRRDIDIRKHTNGYRKPLSSVLSGADFSIPIVVLDHQTEYFGEAQEAGADLLLSGHTHNGQMFPLTAFSRLRYLHNYGRYQEKDLTHIVSSGCGSWGPPIRMGSRAEIVMITLCS